MADLLQHLSLTWWPQTHAPEPKHRPQRGKPSPATVARRKRRNAAVSEAWRQLPAKGQPRRLMWEQLTADGTDADPQLDPRLLKAIESGLAEFGSEFAVSGRHAERIAKG